MNQHSTHNHTTHVTMYRTHSTPDPDAIPPTDPTPKPVPDDVPPPVNAPVEEPTLPVPPIKAGRLH